MKENNLKECPPDSDPRPFVPEGNYEAVCVKFEVKKYLGSEKKLYLHYEIMQGVHIGTKLFQAINYKYRSFPKASKYYTEWTVANGALPQRRDKMSPRIFKDRAFLVKVKTSKPKYDDGEFKSELFHYSIVERIIEVLT
jgi:hypothetical protein